MTAVGSSHAAPSRLAGLLRDESRGALAAADADRRTEPAAVACAENKAKVAGATRSAGAVLEQRRAESRKSFAGGASETEERAMTSSAAAAPSRMAGAPGPMSRSGSRRGPEGDLRTPAWSQEAGPTRGQTLAGPARCAWRRWSVPRQQPGGLTLRQYPSARDGRRRCRTPAGASRASGRESGPWTTASQPERPSLPAQGRDDQDRPPTIAALASGGSGPQARRGEKVTQALLSGLRYADAGRN